MIEASGLDDVEKLFRGGVPTKQMVWQEIGRQARIYADTKVREAETARRISEAHADDADTCAKGLIAAMQKLFSELLADKCMRIAELEMELNALHNKNISV